nr:hypothetical protein EUGRSUZ_B02181 [Ipomoea trifida]
MHELGPGGLQVPAESLVFMEGEKNHGDPFPLRPGNHVLVHAANGGDRNGGSNNHLAEMLERLESNNNMVRIDALALLPQGEAVLSGLVAHEDRGGPLGELHEVHRVDPEAFPLLGAPRGLDQVDERWDVSGAVETAQQAELLARVLPLYHSVFVLLCRHSSTGSPSEHRFPIHRKIGGAITVHSSKNALALSITQTETSGDFPVPDSATAKASRTQATKSLTAAADIAIFPTSVVKSFSSARILAKTGKAVMESATPMNTRKGPWLTPLDIVARSTKDVPIPNTNGRLIPARAIARAFFPVLFKEFRSSSNPTKNRKNSRPRFANVSKTVRLFAGNTAFRKVLLRPNADGPSKIPP